MLKYLLPPHDRGEHVHRRRMIVIANLYKRHRMMKCVEKNMMMFEMQVLVLTCLGTMLSSSSLFLSLRSLSFRFLSLLFLLLFLTAFTASVSLSDDDDDDEPDEEDDKGPEH